MDSDDEFMSGISDSQEEDFGAQQDSDDGSLGDGKCAILLVIYSIFCSLMAVSRPQSSMMRTSRTWGSLWTKK
jgi:hypothetical protein